MNDTFWEDLANIPTLSEAEAIHRPDGGRFYPSLIAAEFDGFRPLMIDLTLPPGSGPHPVVLYIHGGGWVIGSPKITNATLLRFDPFERIVGAGYALARVSYRLVNEARFPAQIHDVLACIRYVRAKADRFGLDAARLAVLGESAGGYLALMAGLAGEAFAGEVGVKGQSSGVQAVVNWYGVTDLLTIAEQGHADGRPQDPGARPPAERLLGRASDPEIVRYASPISHISATAPPVLTQHDTADRLVPFAQALQLHKAMTAAGARHHLDPIEGADHCFWNAQDTGLTNRMLGFLGTALS